MQVGSRTAVKRKGTAWTYRMVLIYWAALFLGFGPLYWLLFRGATIGTMFPGNTFASTMVQGLFISTFAAVCMVFYVFFNRKRPAESA